MKHHGDTAVLAVMLFRDLQDARLAWQMASERHAPKTPTREAQGTFLSLCEAGRVVGVPAAPTGITSGVKKRTLLLLTTLQRSAETQGGRLWLQTLRQEGTGTGELDVLLALWDASLLHNGLTETP